MGSTLQAPRDGIRGTLSGKREREWIFRLRTLPAERGGSLDGYVFQNKKHAVEWLSQEFVTDNDYKIEVCTGKRRRCCGEWYSILIKKVMKPSEFIVEHEKLVAEVVSA